MVFFSILRIFAKSKFELRPLYDYNLSRSSILHDGKLHNYINMHNIVINNRRDIEFQIGYENFFSTGQMRSKEFEEQNFEININFKIENIKRRGAGFAIMLGSLIEGEESGKLYSIGGIFTGLLINFDIRKNQLQYKYLKEETLSENLQLTARQLIDSVFDHFIQLKITCSHNSISVSVKDLNKKYVEIVHYDEKLDSKKNLILASKNDDRGISKYLINSINFYERMPIKVDISKESGYRYYHYLLIIFIICGLLYILYFNKRRK